MQELTPYIQIVNKEGRRKRRTLFQDIILKKANSKLILEMIRNDPLKAKTNYIYFKTVRFSNAHKVAKYVKYG
jgi:hypothetical protein